MSSSVVPSHLHEAQSWTKAFGAPLPPDCPGFYVIGCDEAGRGPLAGPVVTAACCIWVSLPTLDIKTTATTTTTATMLSMIPEITTVVEGLAPLRDSKQIKESVRAELFRTLQKGLVPPSSSGPILDNNPFFTDPNALEVIRQAIVSSGDTQLTALDLKAMVRGDVGGCRAFLRGEDGTSSSSLPSEPQVMSFCYRLVTTDEIDSLNILHASLLGMVECAITLLGHLAERTGLNRSSGDSGSGKGKQQSPPLPPVLLLIDGPHMPLEIVEVLVSQQPPAPASPPRSKAGAKRARSEGGKGQTSPSSPPPGPAAAFIPLPHPHGLPLNSKPLPVYADVLKRRLKANPHLAVGGPCSSSSSSLRPNTLALEKLLWFGDSSKESSNIGDTQHGGEGEMVQRRRRFQAAALPVIKGDALCPSIALASIVAKEVRDGFMTHILGKLVDGRDGVQQQSNTTSSTKKKKTSVKKGSGDAGGCQATTTTTRTIVPPQYGLADHKGYPVPAHMAALKQHGVVRGLHRFSFAPVAASLPKGATTTTPAAALLSLDDFVDALLRS